MGKIHNIATGIMMTGAILGIGNEAVSQTTGNSNSKANIGQVQDSTKSQIVDIDTLDHEMIIHMKIDEILDKYGDINGSSIIREHAIIEINNLRKKYGLGDLQESLDLDLAAQLHATRMNKYGILSHTGKNGSNFAQRAEMAGFSGILDSENIGMIGEYERRTIYHMVLNQIESKMHLLNLTNKESLYVGFGVCGQYYVVVLGK